MDCDLIEAECSHRVPSVNSPHRSFFPCFFLLFFYSSQPYFSSPQSKMMQDFKNMLLAFKTSGMFLSFVFVVLFFLLLFLANICKHVVNITNSSCLLKSTVVGFLVSSIQNSSADFWERQTYNAHSYFFFFFFPHQQRVAGASHSNCLLSSIEELNLNPCRSYRIPPSPSPSLGRKASSLASSKHTSCSTNF